MGERINAVMASYDGEIMVTLGNEPNLDNEWGKNADPEAIADGLVALADELDSNEKVRLLVPAVSFCGGQCEVIGIDPTSFYARLYQRLKERVASGVINRGYQELVTAQWIKVHLGGFGAHIFPENLSDSESQIQEVITTLRKSGLVDEESLPRIIVDEIGLPGGLPVDHAGTVACQTWERISQTRGARIELATIYARSDDTNPTQLGFYFQSNSCEDVITIR